MDLKEPKTATFTTVILDLNLSDHDFLRQPASQLQCGAGGALRLSGGASYGGIIFIYQEKRPRSPMCDIEV